jgi:hypothetical protein
VELGQREPIFFLISFATIADEICDLRSLAEIALVHRVRPRIDHNSVLAFGFSLEVTGLQLWAEHVALQHLLSDH